MSKHRDYVPANDGAFDAWFKILIDYVILMTTGQPPAWTHIPVSEVTLLSAAYDTWHAMYLPTLRPHTPAETLAKDTARADAEAVVRPFVGQWLMWKQVSNQQRLDMSLHIAAPRRSRIPPPATVPELSPRAGLPRQVLIFYRDKGASKRGKPADVHGIEVRWALLDHAPTDIKELTNSTFDTKSPLTLVFEEHDRGKRIYMAGCWEIEREGIKGEYGDIVSAVVP